MAGDNSKKRDIPTQGTECCCHQKTTPRSQRELKHLNTAVADEAVELVKKLK